MMLIIADLAEDMCHAAEVIRSDRRRLSVKVAKFYWYMKGIFNYFAHYSVKYLISSMNIALSSYFRAAQPHKMEQKENFKNAI